MNETRSREFLDDPDPSLAEENFLATLEIDHLRLVEARDHAERQGGSLESHLIAGEIISETAFYSAMAAHLRLGFLEVLPVTLMKDTEGLDLMLKLPHAVRLQDPRSGARTALVPRLATLQHLQAWLRDAPELRSRLFVTTPSSMRAAVWECGAKRRLHDSVSSLLEAMPQHSARIPVTGRQGFWIGVASMIAAGSFVQAPNLALALLHLALSLIYLGTLVFRLLAHLPSRRLQDVSPEAPPGPSLPVYTVLVALYREAEVVPQLVNALRQLDWPRSRLDVKFVCEAEDDETLSALAGLDLPSYMEVVIVPDGLPKTKPKALNYALAGARGEFVTIFDAEDRPHPGQLKEAHARFRQSGAELACLQAPLAITNPQEGWLSSLFAAEYTIHFQRILPFLAAHALPVPLGGTSNHFRRQALEHSGGWDPYNVTEDADLGLRLHRLGYRVGTISLPTLEDAPTSRRVWLRQRTRWYKGWLQTLLVSLRDPAQLARELGGAGLAVYLLNTCGMLASALFHPLLFLSLGWLGFRLSTADQNPFTGIELAFLAIDLINLFASYAYFMLAGFFLQARGEKKNFGWRHVLMIPPYWILLSAASWLALIELYRKPHFWAKTPHRAMAPHATDQVSEGR